MLDTSLNAGYLSSRDAEHPLPPMVRGGLRRGGLGEERDGFGEEMVQPPLNITLPFPVDQLQAVIFRLLGAAGMSIVRNEGTGSSGPGGSSSGAGSAAGAGGSGAYFGTYLRAANPDIFGDTPGGQVVGASPSASVPSNITLYPPSPQAILLTNPFAPHAGPSAYRASTPISAGGGPASPQSDVTAGAEASDVRRISVQVAESGRWLVDFFITPTLDGDPDATDNTVTLVTGTLWHEVLTNAAYTVLTDASGLAEFDVEIADVATRYFYASVRPVFATSGAVTWLGPGTPGAWLFNDPVQSGQYLTVGF